MKKLLVTSLFFMVFLTMNTQAFAHVVVRPAEVGVAERVTFSVQVPTEGDFPTTQVRLDIPEALTSVRPNVKSGWNIELVKTGEGDAARVSEIIWSGGIIPAEQRDEFFFSAQAPAEPGKLAWKAYQTYIDGTVVSWDANPDTISSHGEHASGSANESEMHPFSVTEVINDIAEDNESDETPSIEKNLLVYGVLVSLIMSGFALYLQLKKK